MTELKDKNTKALRDEEIEKLSGGWKEEQLTPEEREEYHRLLDAFESGYDDGTTSYNVLMDYIQELYDKYGG